MIWMIKHLQWNTTDVHLSSDSNQMTSATEFWIYFRHMIDDIVVVFYFVDIVVLNRQQINTDKDRLHGLKPSECYRPILCTTREYSPPPPKKKKKKKNDP